MSSQTRRIEIAWSLSIPHLLILAQLSLRSLGALADRLGLDVIGQRQARSAAVSVLIDESYAYFEYDGRHTVTPVWINDDYPGVLIGVITLEALGLAVDLGTGKLIDSELLFL